MPLLGQKRWTMSNPMRLQEWDGTRWKDINPNPLRVGLPKDLKEAPWFVRVPAELEQSPDGIVELGPATVYAVASDSQEDAPFYPVQVYRAHGGVLIVCHCKGFRYRDRCRHADEVAKKIGLST